MWFNHTGCAGAPTFWFIYWLNWLFCCCWFIDGAGVGVAFGAIPVNAPNDANGSDFVGLNYILLLQAAGKQATQAAEIKAQKTHCWSYLFTSR